jgi:hypothetical protein
VMLALQQVLTTAVTLAVAWAVCTLLARRR